MLREYFAKMKGTATSPPRVGIGDILSSWVGAFLGIAAVSCLKTNSHKITMTENGVSGCFSEISPLFVYQSPG